MSIQYECNKCGWKFDYYGGTDEEKCPNCGSQNVGISTKEYVSTSTNDIKLSPVKTLDEWFANLPLIYKIDLYNSISGTITKHLK